MAFKQLTPTHRSSMALFLLLITLLVVPFVSFSASALIPLHGELLPSLAFTLWDLLLAILTSSRFYFFLLNFLIVSLIILSGVLEPLGAPGGHSSHQGLHNCSMDAQRTHERLALDDELIYASQAASSLPYLDVLERSHTYVADDCIMTSDGFLDDGESHAGTVKEVMGNQAPAAYVMRKGEFSDTDCGEAAVVSSEMDAIVEAVPSAGCVDLDVMQRCLDGETVDLLNSWGRHIHMQDESFLQAGVAGVDVQVIADMDADHGKIKVAISNAGDRSLQSGSNAGMEASEVADDNDAEVQWLQQQEHTKADDRGNGDADDDEKLQWPGIRDGAVQNEDCICNIGIKEEEEEEEKGEDLHGGEAMSGDGKLLQRQSGAQSSNAGGIHSTPGREGDLCAGMGRVERGTGWEEDMARASVAVEGMAMEVAGEVMVMSRDELNERASAFISAFRRKLFHTASDGVPGQM